MKVYQWILPLSTIIGVLIVLFIWVIPEEEEMFKQQDVKRIQELEHHNKRLLEVNNILDDRVFLLETLADSLRALIAKDKTVIATLKTKKDEKIRVIDRYTDDELYRYFSGLSTQSASDQK